MKPFWQNEICVFRNRNVCQTFGTDGRKKWKPVATPVTKNWWTKAPPQRQFHEPPIAIMHHDSRQMEFWKFSGCPDFQIQNYFLYIKISSRIELAMLQIRSDDTGCGMVFTNCFSVNKIQKSTKKCSDGRARLSHRLCASAPCGRARLSQLTWEGGALWPRKIFSREKNVFRFCFRFNNK